DWAAGIMPLGELLGVVAGTIGCRRLVIPVLDRFAKEIHRFGRCFGCPVALCEARAFVYLLEQPVAFEDQDVGDASHDNGQDEKRYRAHGTCSFCECWTQVNALKL